MDILQLAEEHYYYTFAIVFGIGLLQGAILARGIRRKFPKLKKYAKGVSIILGNKAKKWLAERGYEPAYGARPLARVVQEHIKKPLADMILFGELTMGGEVIVDIENNKITIKNQNKVRTKTKKVLN